MNTTHDASAESLSSEPDSPTDEAIRVQVLLFGALREELGRSTISLRLDAPSTGADLLNRLMADHPSLEKWAGSLRLAIDQEYASVDTPLSGSEEVALIPPVSGG